MKQKTYNVVFKGYRIDENRDSLPESSGIYMIYRCKRGNEPNTVSLIELFYIGKSKNLRQEICNHKRREEFLAQAKEGEMICYSYALVDNNDLDIVENALIFSQKPRLNEYLKDNFIHEKSIFMIEGRCALLKYRTFTIS